MDQTPRGFEIEVLLAHREWVARTARALVHGDAEAGDLEQDAWLRVLERPPAAAPRAPRAWLAAVLRFTAVDRARAALTRRRHEEGAARPEISPADTAEIVSRAEVAERVARTVLELEEPFRTTVILRYFEGLAPRDIASRMGVPAGTVRTRLHRALERLRAKLDAGHGGSRQAWCLAFLPVLRLPTAGPASTGSLAGTGTVLGGALMTQKALALSAAGLVMAGGLLGWGVARSGPGEASALAAEMERLQRVAAEQAQRLSRLEQQADSVASLRKGAGDRSSRITALEAAAAARPDGKGVRAEIEELSARRSRLEEAVRALEQAAAPVDPARRRKEVLENLKAIADGKRQVALRDAVEDLVRMGDPAVPDIVALLESGFDRQYYGKPTTISGGIPDAINYGGLRQVLMDALRQMATPLAKERLFQIVGRTKRLADLRDLLVPYVRSADPVVVKGLAALVPDMLQRVGEADPGDEVAWDLGRWLARWLTEHGGECGAADLERAVAAARYGADGWPRWAPDLFRLLVKVEPRRAAGVVVALREKSPGLAADHQAMVVFTMGPGTWTVPLARWAEYYRALLPSLTPADTVRNGLYACMPSVCSSAIQDPVARAEDGRVFLALLEELLAAESTDTNRYTLESHIGMLRASIAREGR